MLLASDEAPCSLGHTAATHRNSLVTPGVHSEPQSCVLLFPCRFNALCRPHDPQPSLVQVLQQPLRQHPAPAHPRDGVWGLGFRVWGLEFRVWGLGFRVWGLGFRV